MRRPSTLNPRLLCLRVALALGLLAALGGVAPPALSSEDALGRRSAAQAVFLRLTAEGRYEEAETVAMQVVELTAAHYGDQSIELATPLTNLATTRLSRGNLVEAETGYLAVIRLIERHAGPLSPHLVNPLTGLGETMLRDGRYGPARDSYERALRVNHAEAGFYNTEQLKIMDGLSEAWLGLHDMEQANRQQSTQLAIRKRRLAADDPELATAYFKLGRWYNRTGQYPEARAAWQTGRWLAQDTRGDTDPAAVDALIGESQSYAGEGVLPASVSALKRALTLIDARPERDYKKRAEVLVALGDLYMIAGQSQSARTRYMEAWNDLTGANLVVERAAYFDHARRLSGPELPQAVDAEGRERKLSADNSNLPKGAVLAGFSVDANGHADNIRIIESDPPDLLDRRVLRTLDESQFRPRLQAGTPVKSEQEQFRHEFHFTPQTPSSDSPTSDETPAGQRGEPIGYPGQTPGG